MLPEIDTSDPNINVVETITLDVPELSTDERKEEEEFQFDPYYIDLEHQVSHSLRRNFKDDDDDDEEESKSQKSKSTTGNARLDALLSDSDEEEDFGI